MKLGSSTQKVIRFASMPSPPLNFYVIDKRNIPYGNVTHMFDAVLIRLFAERFRAKYEVLSPSDGAFGSKMPNGSWNGMVGMVERSEADLAMASIALTQERCEAIQFSYPHLQSPLTFMTNKPTPVSKTMAIVYPYSYEVWILFAVCLMVVSLAFYVLMRRKRTLEIVILGVFGSFLEQDVGFAVYGYELRLLAISWFFSAMIITCSYKAILLSFLTFPTLSGIRDISDLSEAISSNLITCFTYKGTYTPKEFFESDEESRKALGKCLLDNEDRSGLPNTYFPTFPGRKAFIGAELFLSLLDRDFFVSKDSFYNHYFGIAISKNFCCAKYLNDLIHRFNAAGLFLKYWKDEKFFLQFQIPPFDSSEPAAGGKIELEDISGAFYILISGWISALMILLAEIIVKKWSVH